MSKVLNSVIIVSGAGGVGKTALATTLSALWASEHGLRVLLVDAAPQANATLAMGLNPFAHGKGRSFVNAVTRGNDLQAVNVRERLDLVVAGPALADLVTPLTIDPEGAAGFAATLNSVGHRYDRIVVDLPTADGTSIISTVALQVGEYLVAPTTDHGNHLEGLQVLGDVIKESDSESPSEIILLGVVLYNVSASATRARCEACNRIRRILGGTAEPFETIVRSASAAYTRALERGMLIHEYSDWAATKTFEQHIKDRTTPPRNLTKVVAEFKELAREINDRIADVERITRRPTAISNQFEKDRHDG